MRCINCGVPFGTSDLYKCPECTECYCAKCFGDATEDTCHGCQRKQQMEKEKKNREEWENRAKDLWSILDGIDTLSDAIKPTTLKGYEAFYAATMAKVKGRFAILITDGYVLSVPEIALGSLSELGINAMAYAEEHFIEPILFPKTMWVQRRGGRAGVWHIGTEKKDAVWLTLCAGSVWAPSCNKQELPDSQQPENVCSICAERACAKRIKELKGRAKTPEELEEGDTCLECVRGLLKAQPNGDCSCHINPPCDACVEGTLICSACGWEVPKEA